VRLRRVRIREEEERDEEKRRERRITRTVERNGGAGGTAAPAQMRCLRRRFAAWTPRPRWHLVEMVEDARSASPIYICIYTRIYYT